MFRLDFLKNVHELARAPQSTVRLGDKWLRRALVPGTSLMVCETGAPLASGRAAVSREVSFCRLGEVPQRLLDLEHDPVCRTRDGLMATMRRTYGDHVGPNSQVTVIVYELLS